MRRGFTVVEVVVVVFIIAVLSAVIIPITSNLLAKSRDTTRIANCQNYQEALQGYFEVNGFFPGSSGDPEGDEYANGKIPENVAFLREMAPFTLNNFPRDPLYDTNQEKFFYYYDAKQSNFLQTTGKLITIHAQSLEIKQGNRKSYPFLPTDTEGQIHTAQFILVLQDPKNK